MRPHWLQRYEDKFYLFALEKKYVKNKYDWLGYSQVIERFRPETFPWIYLNQKWSEWEGLMNFLSAKGAPQSALEIGTGRGGSLYFLSKLAKKKSNLISIDINPAAAHYADLFPRHRNQKITCLTANSVGSSTFDQIKERLGNQCLDILYIDGDHTYEGVKRDFDTYKSLCNSNSFICFHDICPDYHESRGIDTIAYSGQVYKFWRELREQFQHWEFIESQEQDGFGIGVIRLVPLGTKN